MNPLTDGLGIPMYMLFINNNTTIDSVYTILTLGVAAVCVLLVEY